MSLLTEFWMGVGLLLCFVVLVVRLAKKQRRSHSRGGHEASVPSLGPR